MSETKFTKGPWAIGTDVDDGRDFGEFDIIAPDGDDDPWNIARTFGGIGNDGESEPLANAHLIAASPRLYEATSELLELLIEVIGDDYGPDDCGELCSDRCCQAVGCVAMKFARARAALSQARGEK